MYLHLVSSCYWNSWCSPTSIPAGMWVSNQVQTGVKLTLYIRLGGCRARARWLVFLKKAHYLSSSPWSVCWTSDVKSTWQNIRMLQAGKTTSWIVYGFLLGFKLATFWLEPHRRRYMQLLAYYAHYGKHEPLQTFGFVCFAHHFISFISIKCCCCYGFNYSLVFAVKPYYTISKTNILFTASGWCSCEARPSQMSFLCLKAYVCTVIQSASYSSFNCNSQLEETRKGKVLWAALLYHTRDKSQSNLNFASELFPSLLVKGGIQYQLLREHRLSRYRKESWVHASLVHNKHLSKGVTSKAISSRWFCEITAIHKRAKR